MHQFMVRSSVGTDIHLVDCLHVIYIYLFCVLQDYSLSRIDLFAEVNGMGRMSSFCDDVVEIGSYAHQQTTGSIKVHSGV